VIGKLRRSLDRRRHAKSTLTGVRERAFNERFRTALHTLHTEQFAVVFGDRDHSHRVSPTHRTASSPKKASRS